MTIISTIQRFIIFSDRDRATSSPHVKASWHQGASSAFIWIHNNFICWARLEFEPVVVRDDWFGRRDALQLGRGWTNVVRAQAAAALEGHGWDDVMSLLWETTSHPISLSWCRMHGYSHMSTFQTCIIFDRNPTNLKTLKHKINLRKCKYHYWQLHHLPLKHSTLIVYSNIVYHQNI